MAFFDMVEYFPDGKYKNLCYHKAGFSTDANWTFSATSQGKSPCDGIWETVKRLTAQASF